MPKTNYYKTPTQIAEEKLVKWIKLHVKQKDIADFLGCTQANISYKLNHGHLNTIELLAIMQLVDAEPLEVGKLLTNKY